MKKTISFVLAIALIFSIVSGTVVFAPFDFANGNNELTSAFVTKSAENKAPPKVNDNVKQKKENAKKLNDPELLAAAPHVENTVNVQLAEGCDESVLYGHGAVSATKIFDKANMYTAVFDGKKELTDVLTELNNDDKINFAEPDFIFEVAPMDFDSASKGFNAETQVFTDPEAVNMYQDGRAKADAIEEEYSAFPPAGYGKFGNPFKIPNQNLLRFKNNNRPDGYGEGLMNDVLAPFFKSKYFDTSLLSGINETDSLEFYNYNANMLKQKLPEVWKKYSKGNNVPIAILEDGYIDFSVKDLYDNRWENPGETGLDAWGNNKETNGIDDDNNGYVDDVWGLIGMETDPGGENNRGLNSETCLPRNSLDHATMVASVAAAAGGNYDSSNADQTSLVGVAPEAKIVSLVLRAMPNTNAYSTDSSKPLYAAGTAYGHSMSMFCAQIDYCEQNGIKIINCSYGFDTYDTYFKTALCIDGKYYADVINTSNEAFRFFSGLAFGTAGNESKTADVTTEISYYRANNDITAYNSTPTDCVPYFFGNNENIIISGSARLYPSPITAFQTNADLRAELDTALEPYGVNCWDVLQYLYTNDSDIENSFMEKIYAKIAPDYTTAATGYSPRDPSTYTFGNEKFNALRNRAEAYLPTLNSIPSDLDMSFTSLFADIQSMYNSGLPEFNLFTEYIDPSEYSKDIDGDPADYILAYPPGENVRYPAGEISYYTDYYLHNGSVRSPWDYQTNQYYGNGVGHMIWAGEFTKIIACGIVYQSLETILVDYLYPEKSYYSNLGPKSVDIYASMECYAYTGHSTWKTSDPGVNTIRTVLGTSFASPQAAALAALLWGYDPSLTNLEVKKLICEASKYQEWHPEIKYGLMDPLSSFEMLEKWQQNPNWDNDRDSVTGVVYPEWDYAYVYPDISNQGDKITAVPGQKLMYTGDEYGDYLTDSYPGYYPGHYSDTSAYWEVIGYKSDTAVCNPETDVLIKTYYEIYNPDNQPVLEKIYKIRPPDYNPDNPTYSPEYYVTPTKIRLVFRPYRCFSQYIHNFNRTEIRLNNGSSRFTYTTNIDNEEKAVIPFMGSWYDKWNSVYDFIATDWVTIEPPPTPTYTVTTAATTGGTVSNGGTFESGASVTLTATPDTGYTFDGWYENGVKIPGATATYTFTATADRNLQARFKKSYKLGDPNSDNEINIFDIMAIRDHIFGKSTLVDDAFMAADVNGDEDVNIFDIMAIRDHIFGKKLIDG